MRARLPALLLVAAVGLLSAGCDFDFPLTSQPTRPIDSRLLGDWVYVDVDGQRIERLSVRKWDDATFVVSNDGETYRAYHSDFAGLAFVSVQELHSGPGKYLYVVYELSADGTRLGLRCLDPKAVPETVKDQAAIQRFIKQNLGNPKIFGPEALYSRPKIQ